LDLIPDFHEGIGSFYYNMWAPAGTMWHQEDAVALLSPQFYNEFIREYDDEITKTFAGCIMHQHPTGYMPYKKYLEMNFTALELHIDEGGPSAEELFKVYESIQKVKPLIIWGKICEKDMDFLFHNLDKRGLAVYCMLDSKQEAERLWNKYILNK